MEYFTYNKQQRLIRTPLQLVANSLQLLEFDQKIGTLHI